MQNASPSSSALPRGGMLLHIGVHKSGTTAIQAAFENARPSLADCGVSYPGEQQAHRAIASSALGRPLGWRTTGANKPDVSAWNEFVQHAQAYPGITVCSSEFFAEADNEAAAEIVSRVGLDRIHVVLTLRNLGKILPSAWQQMLKSGFEMDYATWLTDILSTPHDQMHPKSKSFWIRHSHGEVVKRWADLVGSERLTVVVVDDSDRTAIYGAFEQLLGMPQNFLLAFQASSHNRSMTVPEAELIRALNIAVGGGKGWKPYSQQQHDSLIKAITEGRLPPTEEARLVTPQWALDAAADLGRSDVDVIEQLGVHVIGNLEKLAERLTEPTHVSESPPDTVPIDVAVAATLGAMKPGMEPKPAASFLERFRLRLSSLMKRGS